MEKNGNGINTISKDYFIIGIEKESGWQRATTESEKDNKSGRQRVRTNRKRVSTNFGIQNTHMKQTGFLWAIPRGCMPRTSIMIIWHGSFTMTKQKQNGGIVMKLCSEVQGIKTHAGKQTSKRNKECK